MNVKLVAIPQAEPIGIPIGSLEIWGGPSRTRAFALVKAGKLESYRLGKARMVTLESLRQLINQIDSRL